MKIYELLDNKSKWTKGESFRDINNNPVSLDDQSVAKWCLLGAAYKVYGKHCHDIYDKIAHNLPKGFYCISFFNDTSTYEEVINFCKKLDI